MGFATVATFKDGNITSWSQMTTSVPILIGQYQGEILVVDGLTATSHQNIAGASFTWLQNKLRSKELVFVASHGNIFKTKELEEANAKVKFIPSWIKQQYEKAISNDEFYSKMQRRLGEDGITVEHTFDSDVCAGKDVVLHHDDTTYTVKTTQAHSQGDKHDFLLFDKNRWLEEKYDVAGKNARWLFGYHMEKVFKEIDFCFDACDTCIDDIIDNKIGERSKNVVNTLRAAIILDNGTITYEFISRYVLRHALKLKINDRKFMEALTAFAKVKNNPSFDGWVLEFDFLHQLRLCMQRHEPITLTSLWKQTLRNGAVPTPQPKPVKIEWKVSHMRSFKNIDEIASLNPTVFCDGMFLLPTKWNQGGFDAVHLTKSADGTYIVRFIQVTGGAKHSWKGVYYKQMASAISRSGVKVSSYEVVFMIAVEDKFKIISPVTDANALGDCWNQCVEIVKFDRAGSLD